MRPTPSQLVLLSLLFVTPLLSGCVREMSHLALYAAHDKCGENNEACPEKNEQQPEQKPAQKTQAAPVKQVQKK